MRFHVAFLMFDTVTDPPQVELARAVASAAFKVLQSDPRISSTGYFVGRRGGYFVIELKDASEVMPLIGPLLDRFQVTVQPLGEWSMVQAIFDQARAGK